jgi:hypothetical protein
MDLEYQKRNIDLLYENNFLLIDNFLPVEECNFLSEEFKTFCVENNVPSDKQCGENSFGYYNFKPFLQILCESVKPLCEYLGDKVLPSFCYGRVYYTNSDLPIHIDRPECEISISCNLGGDKIWPFYIENGNGEMCEVNMYPGNAILYLGRKAPHYRDPFDGEFNTQVMFFYNRTYGEYSEHYFDRVNQKENNYYGR